jgi:hypothetical protein
MLTKREENQLLVLEKKVIRTICGPEIKNGVYRKTTNSINCRTRRSEDLPQKTLFRAEPNGIRNQGRPKSRWVDGVNNDSLALGVRDWMHCAQDRQTW